MNLQRGFSWRGPVLILLQGRQEPSPAGQVGSGIHLPEGLPSREQEPCSSTAFLTLASSLGSRNSCRAHTRSRHCSPQHGGQAWPCRTPQNQRLQLLALPALQREVDAPAGPGHSSRAARPGLLPLSPEPQFQTTGYTFIATVLYGLHAGHLTPKC